MSRAERPRPHLLAMVRTVRASRDRGAPARISVLRPANPPNPLPHLSTILSSFSVHVDSVPFTSASDSLRSLPRLGVGTQRRSSRGGAQGCVRRLNKAGLICKGHYTVSQRPVCATKATVEFTIDSIEV